jgi:hypothetical protein
MDWTEYVVAGTVALVLAVTLVSGPLVGAVDFTPDREQQSFSPGEGTIEATVVSVPSTVTLDRGSYGSGAYYLRVPDATVDIESISGQPMLIYKLRIPDLGYARGTTHFVDESHEGRRTVSLERATIEPGKIGREQYRGELLILVRTNGEDETNARRNVTVEVDS